MPAPRGWSTAGSSPWCSTSCWAWSTWSTTGTLKVVLKRPTPLLKEITLRAWPSGGEGRKLYVTGEMVCDGAVTASAEGIFVRTDRLLIDDP